MPRAVRNAPGGYIYHVINHANGKLSLFHKPKDFIAFQNVLLEAVKRRPLRILDWVFMRNHWHFVVWPEHDDDVSEFFRWLTLTHTQRWHAAHRTTGSGHLYRDRFKSFPVESGPYLLTLLRYVERNPLRAGIVQSAFDYPWGSAHVRLNGSDELRSLLCDWPIEVPRDWQKWVNRPQTDAEVEAIRISIKRGRPLGSAHWIAKTAERLDLSHTLRPRGRQPGWRKPE
jgi:putative transposase